MDEHAAVVEIQRVEHRVRVEFRWYGVSCLALSAGAFAYVVLGHLLGVSHMALTALFVAVFAAHASLRWRRGEGEGAITSVQKRFDGIMLFGTLALVVLVLALRGWLLPAGFSVRLLALALLPAFPCLLGGIKVLRA